MSGRIDEWPESRIEARLEEIERARATCMEDGREEVLNLLADYEPFIRADRGDA